MLLTLTTNREPATDLGYLLHKHPDRVQSYPLSSGAVAHVCYPYAEEFHPDIPSTARISPATCAIRNPSSPIQN